MQLYSLNNNVGKQVAPLQHCFCFPPLVSLDISAAAYLWSSFFFIQIMSKILGEYCVVTIEL